MVILYKAGETRQIFQHLNCFLFEFQILVVQKNYSFAINVLKNPFCLKNLWYFSKTRDSCDYNNHQRRLDFRRSSIVLRTVFFSKVTSSQLFPSNLSSTKALPTATPKNCNDLEQNCTFLVIPYYKKYHKHKRFIYFVHFIFVQWIFSIKHESSHKNSLSCFWLG